MAMKRAVDGGGKAGDGMSAGAAALSAPVSRRRRVVVGGGGGGGAEWKARCWSGQVGEDVGSNGRARRARKSDETRGRRRGAHSARCSSSWHSSLPPSLRSTHYCPPARSPARSTNRPKRPGWTRRPERISSLQPRGDRALRLLSRLVSLAMGRRRKALGSRRGPFRAR